MALARCLRARRWMPTMPSNEARRSRGESGLMQDGASCAHTPRTSYAGCEPGSLAVAARSAHKPPHCAESRGHGQHTYTHVHGQTRARDGRCDGVTTNPVLPHTGPPGTDPLAESIPRNESASIFDPPRITSASVPVSDPSPRIRSHPEPTGGSGDAELSDSKVCLYTLYILCRHVILFSYV